MKRPPAHRRASTAAALRSVLALVVLAALACRAASARQPSSFGSAVPPSASSRALTEAEVRALIQKDLYPGEKTDMVILYETLPGKAHFPARGSAPDSNPTSAPEFQAW